MDEDGSRDGAEPFGDATYGDQERQSARAAVPGAAPDARHALQAQGRRPYSRSRRDVVGLLGSRGSRAYLGVDLGSRTARLALVRRKPAHNELLAWAARDLPEGADPDQAVRVLRDMVGSLGGRKASRTYAVLSGPDVLLRRASLPRMPDRELREAVRWESKKHLPYPVEQAVIDYQVLGEVREEGATKLDLLIVAARAELVESRLAVLQRAGVEVHGLMAAPFALGNVVASQARDREGLAVVDLGSRSSRIAFFDPDGSVTLSRDIAVGGDDLTDALAGAFEDPHQSEAFKRRYGIAGSRQGEDGGQTEPLAQPTLMMRPVLERLLSEIERSIHYYRTRFGGGLVGRLLLAGGGAGLVGLDTYLAEGLGIQVAVLDPVGGMAPGGVPAEGAGPGLAVAVGLALASGREPNLLPARAKRRYRLAGDRLAMRVTALAAVLILVILSMFAALEKKQLVSERNGLQAQWLGVQPLLSQERASREEIRRTEGILTALQVRGDATVGPLKKLTHAIPSYVVLTELSLKPNSAPERLPQKLEIAGRIQANRLFLESYLAKFAMDLERAGFASPTVLSKSVVELERGAQLQFRLSCGLE